MEGLVFVGNKTNSKLLAKYLKKNHQDIIDLINKIPNNFKKIENYLENGGLDIIYCLSRSDVDLILSLRSIGLSDKSLSGISQD